MAAFTPPTTIVEREIMADTSLSTAADQQEGSTATMTTTLDIPVIDLSLDPDQVVADLMKALTTIGFATLINHGLPDDLIPKTFRASKAFFDLPTTVKRQYPFQGSESNRGYIGVGSEILDVVDGGNTAADNPMYKESLEVGKEDRELGGVHRNEWPVELETTSFREDILEYFHTMDALQMTLMRYIGIGLKLDDPEYLVERCNAQHENLRLLHYPPLPDRAAARANLHTDYGTITLLAQDLVGGLQVLTVDGHWIHVTPVENAIVLNVGEMLMRWSNDVLKATLHQVMAPATATTSGGGGGGLPERYSIAFFCNPNKDALLECLGPCCDDEEQGRPPAKYEPINAHDYITKRLSDTIKDPVKVKVHSTV